GPVLRALRNAPSLRAVGAAGAAAPSHRRPAGPLLSPEPLARGHGACGPTPKPRGGPKARGGAWVPPRVCSGLALQERAGAFHALLVAAAEVVGRLAAGPAFAVALLEAHHVAGAGEPVPPRAVADFQRHAARASAVQHLAAVRLG